MFAVLFPLAAHGASCAEVSMPRAVPAVRFSVRPAGRGAIAVDTDERPAPPEATAQGGDTARRGDPAPDEPRSTRRAGHRVATAATGGQRGTTPKATIDAEPGADRETSAEADRDVASDADRDSGAGRKPGPARKADRDPGAGRKPGPARDADPTTGAAADDPSDSAASDGDAADDQDDAAEPSAGRQASTPGGGARGRGTSDRGDDAGGARDRDTDDRGGDVGGARDRDTDDRGGDASGANPGGGGRRRGMGDRGDDAGIARPGGSARSRGGDDVASSGAVVRAARQTSTSGSGALPSGAAAGVRKSEAVTPKVSERAPFASIAKRVPIKHRHWKPTERSRGARHTPPGHKVKKVRRGKHHRPPACSAPHLTLRQRRECLRHHGGH